MSATDASANAINPASDDLDDGVSLIELATALGEEKGTVFGWGMGAALLALLVSLLMPNIYTARTVLLPPQQQQSGASAALASLGALAGLAGSAAGIKSPDEMYVAFLGSEAIQNSLIEQLKLRERYEEPKMVDVRKMLKDRVRISSDKKSGLISVEADDRDAEFAARLANLHVSELRMLLGRLAVSEAQQRRLFFEQQLRKVQETLAVAELAFRQAKEKSGLQVTQALAEVGVKASAELRGQIAAREVQLQAMSRFATPQNPDVQRVSSELAALRAQLARVEQGSGEGGVVSLPVRQEAIKAYRDVRVQEAMLEVLVKQYELARVDEAKEGPLLQQVDVAQAPERKSKPKRTVIVLASGLAGLLLGGFVAFLRRFLRRSESDPQARQQWIDLRNAWRLRQRGWA